MKPADRFELSIEWSGNSGGKRYRTLAAFAARVDNEIIWPAMANAGERLEWFSDDLLSHLTECWKPLALRQTYPIPVHPGRPSLLRTEGEKRWAELSAARAESEEERVSAFEDVHDLANAFGGVFGLPSLWLLRSRDTMLVESNGRMWFVPYLDAIQALTRAGDEIARQLEQVEPQRWSRLLLAWHRRNDGGGEELLAWSLGVDRRTASFLLDQRVLPAPGSVVDAANDDELRIAARMAGSLRAEEIKAIIELVRTCPPRPAPKLDMLASDAKAQLRRDEAEETYPYEEGVAVAKWLRARLGLGHGAVAPFDVLDRLGVDVRTVSTKPTSLDAVAVWGTRHGPSVLINADSRRLTRKSGEIRQDGAARVTAAHELCHLLLDRDHVLAAVEILNGRMPLRLEQRARAFAAEFLLPGDAAGEAWRAAGHPLDVDGIEQLLKALCQQFEVTRSVAAWKLEHGLDLQSQNEIASVLDEVAPNRRGPIEFEPA